MTRALLDTHIFFGLSQKDNKITSISLERLNKFDKLFISPLSIWELALLIRKKRINLEFNLEIWISEFLRKSGVKLINCSAEILIEANNLPGIFHNDPCDRIIVATARMLNATLFTRDQKILDYEHVLSISI